MIDHYPTRRGGEPQLLDRREPTVWGEDASIGPLDAGQVAAFDRDGFLQLPLAFDAAEVARLDAAVDDLVQASAHDPTVIRERGTGDVRSVFGFHEAAGPLADVVADDRIAGAARQLLGSDVAVHQSRVNRKPAFRGKDFAWHSDFETWHAEDGMPRMRCLSAVVSLTGNRTWNGSLLVLPGSHRTFVSCPTPTPADHHERSLQAQEVGVPDDGSLRTLYERHGIHECTGPAGSVLLFDCNLMHGSPSNISPEPRRNLFVVLNSVDNALVEPFAAPAPRPAHLAARPAQLVA